MVVFKARRLLVVFWRISQPIAGIVALLAGLAAAIDLRGRAGLHVAGLRGDRGASRGGLLLVVLVSVVAVVVLVSSC